MAVGDLRPVLCEVSGLVHDRPGLGVGTGVGSLPESTAKIDQA